MRGLTTQGYRCVGEIIRVVRGGQHKGHFAHNRKAGPPVCDGLALEMLWEKGVESLFSSAVRLLR